MADLAFRNTERLQLLISDLLDFNKLAAGGLQVRIRGETLQPLLDSALEDNAQMAATQGVQLEPETGDLPDLLCDKHRLRQILDNYINNAIKFSPPGGTVRISTGTSSPGWVRIMVSDQGSGVPDAFANRILKRFAQAETGTARSVKGTGLGLAICSELAKLMNGKVGYYNNRGAHFWVELPTAKKTGSTAAEREAKR